LTRRSVKAIDLRAKQRSSPGLRRRHRLLSGGMRVDKGKEAVSDVRGALGGMSRTTQPRRQGYLVADLELYW
jgi:hypothetical protein